MMTCLQISKCRALANQYVINRTMLEKPKQVLLNGLRTLQRKNSYSQNLNNYIKITIMVSISL